MFNSLCIYIYIYVYYKHLRVLKSKNIPTFFLSYLFFPSPDQGATTVLGYHTASGGMTPTISGQQYNPVVDNNDLCPVQTTVSHKIIVHILIHDHNDILL